MMTILCNKQKIVHVLVQFMYVVRLASYGTVVYVREQR